MSPTALITGASSGIGSELARQFADAGYHLVLVARREHKLSALQDEIRQTNPNCQISVFAIDLAEPMAVAKLAQTLAKRGITVHTLVNNAGFGERGEFQSIPWLRQQQMIQLNITALTELTHRLLPAMIEHKQGAILNIASTAAFQPGPLMAVYYASKAYVHSFSQALSEELSDKGITATVLCPGPTATEFQDNAHLTRSRLFSKTSLQSASQVARAGLAGVQKNQRVVISGWRNWLGAHLVRFVPGRLVTRMVKKLHG